jgi:hypothetical protein
MSGQGLAPTSGIDGRTVESGAAWRMTAPTLAINAHRIQSATHGIRPRLRQAKGQVSLFEALRLGDQTSLIKAAPPQTHCKHEVCQGYAPAGSTSC